MFAGSSLSRPLYTLGNHHLNLGISELTKMGRHYKEIAATALQRRESSIPKELLLPIESIRKLPQNLTTVPQCSGHFTPEELEVINTNAQEILLKIKHKTWTALRVTKAFCKAAVVAQQLVCSLFQNLWIRLMMNRPTALLRSSFLKLWSGLGFLTPTLSRLARWSGHSMVFQSL